MQTLRDRRRYRHPRMNVLLPWEPSPFPPTKKTSGTTEVVGGASEKNGKKKIVELLNVKAGHTIGVSISGCKYKSMEFGGSHRGCRPSFYRMANGYIRIINARSYNTAVV